jgi:23S rRNA (uracil1939-C5)-methyltransferase
VFIDGALPGEEVTFRYARHRGRFDEATVVEVLAASAERVEPRCRHFGDCGGCSLQHLAPAAQVRVKQERLLEALTHFGRVHPGSVLEPLTGPEWGYRRRARLSGHHRHERGRFELGFRGRRSHRLTALEVCEVLTPSVGQRLGGLAVLLESLDARDRVPQVEVAAGDLDTALVIRHLVPLGAADRERLRVFAEETGLQVYVQPGGVETVAPLWPAAPRPLSYRLAEWDVELRFLPTDFTQVNGGINPALVRLALDLLAPRPTDRVGDLYCGLGNFTLPLARRAGRVVGVEGDAGLIARARENAGRNGLENVELHAADLAAPGGARAWLAPAVDRLLLDPPRSGALEVVRGLAPPYPERIVYVSCNPETLARDAGELVRAHGYRLTRAGVIDMFPHTAHVESIALFER